MLKNNTYENDFEEDDDLDVNYSPARHIQNKEDTVEITILQDIYTQTEDEQLKLFKSNVKSKQVIFKSDIRSVKEELSKSGKPYKSRCLLLVQGFEPMLVVGSYNYFKSLIYDPIGNKTSIGFSYKGRK